MFTSPRDGSSLEPFLIAKHSVVWLVVHRPFKSSCKENLTAKENTLQKTYILFMKWFYPASTACFLQPH